MSNMYSHYSRTAKATTIPDHCVHLVMVGNAFHWLDHARTREEFLRILKPGGWVVLAWNWVLLKSTSKEPS